KLLDKAIAGTFGSIRETLGHMLEQEGWGLLQLGAELRPPEGVGFERIRMLMVDHGEAWESVLERLPELEARALPEPPDFENPIPHFAVMYMLQTIHHLELHRTHIRATLDTLGVPVPGVDSTDLWAFWAERHGAELPA